MRPENIVEHFVDEWEGDPAYPDLEPYKHEWDITWTPIERWTFDQYGSKDDSWRSDGTITLWESDDYNYRLIIETWKGTFTLSTYVDQWGTYYFGEGDFYIASEEGTRSFWIAYIDALQKFAKLGEFEMTEPTHEVFEAPKSLRWTRED